ncbi:hypothetical protein [Sulfurovum sp.]|uniref:hypothetical protein n=1 Tax=Sulfurovum sp. TaxID=1969726 RepID=UPI003569FF94
MKKHFLIMSIISCISYVHAYEWSVNDYIKNCSIVHQKTISEADKETLGYCMGVLKGSLAGIIVTKSIETGEFKTQNCLLDEERTSFVEIQKNVLATLRLKYKNSKTADDPNTANAAVIFSLIDLYPCLLE